MTVYAGKLHHNRGRYLPLSLRNVEDLLFEHSIDICHETVRMWWNSSVHCSRATSMLRTITSRTDVALAALEPQNS
jgi:transposase-like protein